MPSENSPQNLALTITFIDPDLTPEELDEDAVLLLEELSDRRDIESVDRIRDPHPPEGSMSVGGFLLGKITALVDVTNAKKVFEFLGERLVNKPVSLEVEGNGKKLKVTANKVEDLGVIIQQAKEFIEAS